MTTEWVMVAIAAAAFLFSVFTSAIIATWIVGRSTAGPSFSDVDKGDDELSSRLERDRHDYGEALAALRTRIDQVEFWARDNLARKDDLDGLRTDLRDIWRFIMDRAEIMAQRSGYVERKSPSVPTPLGMRIIEPILPDVIGFCQSMPELHELTIEQLELRLANVFRKRLLDEICRPNDMDEGECIILLMDALRSKKVIPQVDRDLS